MKSNPTNRRGFTLVELLVVIVIIAALAGLTAPMVIRQRKKADQTEAVSNARQIGLGMLDFETEYSSFPDGDSAEQINEINDSNLSTTVSSANDAFRQMIMAGITSSEVMFWCKTAYTGGKPDDITNNEAATLEAGDVGFGYIMKSDGTAYSTAGNTGRVIVAAPLAYTGSFTAGEFDTDYYDGKAVVLKMDNSVTSLTISKRDNKPRFPGGKSLLEGGSDETVWGNSTPTMMNPEPKN